MNKVSISDGDGIYFVDQYVLQPKQSLVETENVAHFFLKLTHSLMLLWLCSSLLESIEIPMPCLQEQQKIADHLDCLREKEGHIRYLQAATQSKSHALVPAILDKRFEGSCK